VRTGKALIALLWLGLLALGIIIGAELWLQHREAARLAGTAMNRPDDATRLGRLTRAYEPPGVQHLHPQYLFFFPLDPADRLAIGNAVCRIDADGFRGPGPRHAAGRKLAFFLGGSSAFGHLASSDAATITSYLNDLQGEYFFVNAGVPAWNSTQELFRLAYQILDYQPALVITYDGANDGALVAWGDTASRAYPAGTPASFYLLERLVDDLRAKDRRPLTWRLFPTLRQWWSPRHVPAPAPPGHAQPADPVMHAAVVRYLRNEARMRDLAAAAGARFVHVFQPVAWLHQHVDPAFDPWRAPDMRARITQFYRLVVTMHPRTFEFHDLSALFDQHFSSVPVSRGDVADDTVFVDPVHLYDPGNKIVAGHLLRILEHSSRP
jgi:hypothetical protein